MQTLKTLAIVVTTISSLALMGNAHAERTFEQMYTECGIGGAIFKNNKTLAAISNITWDLGTTAVSSGYSSEENCQGGKVAAANFIHSSYASLEQDIAKGEGKHLSALMDIMQCDSSAREGLVNTIRADFSNTVSVKGYADAPQFQKSKDLYNIMISDKVAAYCGA